jgi:hypothetical protein
MGVYPDVGRTDVGINSLAIQISDSNSSILSFWNVALSFQNPSERFVLVGDVIQEAGFRPVSLSIANVGSVGYLDTSVFPPRPLASLLRVAQIGQISTTFDPNNNSMLGHCFVETVCLGGSYKDGPILPVVQDISVPEQSRFWGLITSPHSIRNIVAGRIGFSDAEAVDATPRQLQLASPAINTISCERGYVVIAGSTTGGYSNLSRFSASGTPSPADPDAGGLFGIVQAALTPSPSVANPNISANGDLGASVTLIDLPVNADRSAAISVGRSIRSSGGVGFVASQSMRGQVLVNQRNIDGQWLGPVVVGSGSNPISQTSASSGVYLNPSSAFGGGAVGLVPFRLYQADSTLALWGSGSPAPDPNTEGTLLDSVFNRGS